MTIKNMPTSERPREKMLSLGTGSLSNAEIIAMIIGNGTKDANALELSQKILSYDSRGMGFLGQCTISELKKIDGIGDAKGCRLLAAVELGRRLAYLSIQDRSLFESTEDIAEYFMATMRYLSEEHFRIMLLDSQGHMISVEETGVGDIHNVSAHPREIFTSAIHKKAAAIVAAHNHPGGDPTPSGEDMEVTKRLKMAGDIIGIPLIEHIIIGDGSYQSIGNKYYQDMEE